MQTCAYIDCPVSGSIDGRTDLFAYYRPCNGPVGSGSEKAVSNDRVFEAALAVDTELV